MQGIRAFADSIERPSPALLAAVDEFDPEHVAEVITSGFASYATLCDRPVFDHREPAWAAFEDKTVVDGLWDAVGVTRAPAKIIPVPEAAAAAESLAGARGTVWVADNREGWHGGGEYVRWVPRPEDAAAARDWFSARANRVRVMPFLDGIPCSIHGVVTPNGVAVFLPVEMLILRRLDRPGFFYARAATFWMPPATVRDGMREATRAVGAELDRRVRFRGAFGIDGVCTTEGFRPTELNPRFSPGHALQAAAAEVPLGDMNRLLLTGSLDVDASWLEERVVAAADSKRRGDTIFPVQHTLEPARTGVRFDMGRAIAVDSTKDRDAVMQAGSGPGGGMIRLTFDPDRIEVGPSVAPLAVQASRLAVDLWGVDLPPVEAAPDLCVNPHPAPGAS